MPGEKQRLNLMLHGFVRNAAKQLKVNSLRAGNVEGNDRYFVDAKHVHGLALTQLPATAATSCASALRLTITRVMSSAAGVP